MRCEQMDVRNGAMNSFPEMRSEIEEVSGGGDRGLMEEKGRVVDMSRPYYLDKFTLFETASNFYIIGRDKDRLRWRVLKIGRSEPSEPAIFEDPTIYSYPQCKLLLEDISEVNKLSGGRKFVTNCYGIAGFVKFLGPYYILLITERKEIGQINGHPIYSITEYKLIPIRNCKLLSYNDDSERENRYKKLLWLVDLRKDFFFSYSYPIMQSLQKNLRRTNLQQSPDGNMFVWNKILTHHIHNHLKNTLWTVALVHGFFKQVELSVGGKSFLLTLIARRSCQFAGTRYQRRGINEGGEAANDVEIEQIVSQECLSDKPYKITSAVQNRGSIPLLWTQKVSFWNSKPDIIFSEGNENYEATRLHFQKLHQRYGSPIILLNLLKSCGNRREMLIGREYSKVVDAINMYLGEDSQLTLWSLDINAAHRNKSANALAVLKEKAVNALSQIGFFYSHIPESINFSVSKDESSPGNNAEGSNFNIKMIQEGILKTNCLDSLDRTNVAQYVTSLVTLGLQLHALGLTQTPDLDFSDSLAKDLMNIYEGLGNALAQQYAGSAAHSKIFAKTRGECKASTIFQALFINIQRHISNSFLDVEKQQAIDLFLGHFKPEAEGDQLVPPENDSGLKCNTQTRKSIETTKISRSVLKKSQSDNKVLYNGSSSFAGTSEIASTDSDVSDSKAPIPAYTSGRILDALQNKCYGDFDKDTDTVDTQSWTPTTEDSVDRSVRWHLDSPASSAGGLSCRSNIDPIILQV